MTKTAKELIKYINETYEKEELINFAMISMEELAEFIGSDDFDLLENSSKENVLDNCYDEHIEYSDIMEAVDDEQS